MDRVQAEHQEPQDQGFYLFTALITLLYLFLNRNDRVEGTELYMPAVALPSILGAMIAFSMVIGPAYTIAMEKEDGTLLRARSVPNGLIGQVTGHVVSNTLGLIPSFAVILIPSALLFEGVMRQGAQGWFTVAWVVVLALLATLPIGMIIGSLAPGVQKVGTWGMLPVLVLVGSPASSSPSRRSGTGSKPSHRSSPCTGSAWGCGRRSCPTPRRRSRSAGRGVPSRPCWS